MIPILVLSTASPLRRREADEITGSSVFVAHTGHLHDMVDAMGRQLRVIVHTGG